jgi:cytochrome c1
VSADTCSRGRRPRLLFAKPVAGVADPGPRSSTAATTFAHSIHWVRRVTLAIIILFIVSCANLAPPPEVSPALISNARPDHVEAEQLQNGRRLFLSHCLECHTLPRVTKYNPEQWPHLVSRMSGRANLSAGEQAAIVAYLRAASLTPH